MMLAARIRGFFNSLSGRLVLILTVGIASASILSLFVAERARRHDFDRARDERITASAVEMARRFAQDPAGTTALLRDNRIFGARDAPREWVRITPHFDAQLGQTLRAQLGEQSRALVGLVPREQCFPNFDILIGRSNIDEMALPDCWYVQFRDATGVERRLAIDLAPFRVPPNSTLDPLYLVLIVLASMVLSYLVARIATSPLRRLTTAAQAFSVTVDPEPIPVTGPGEVRAALETFNLMQNRIREGFRERTQILASITHELQTPLTRLRLRLEQVEDEPLRERLVSDLAVTQQLVRDGLELARSSESREPWSVVEIDTILSSIAEDASETGADVHFSGATGVRARTKPNALTRCVTNLVDNAVLYGGDAQISLAVAADRITVEVRDHGPGIPEAQLDDVFEPFRRLEAARSTRPFGSGLGLTIARAQARTFGGDVVIRNAPGGGVLSTITWPASRPG